MENEDDFHTIHLNEKSQVIKIRMEIIPFKFKYIPQAFGFMNMGATCYFNALLQGLLTCTSLTEVFLKNKNNRKFTDNPVARIYLSIIDLFMTGTKEDGGLNSRALSGKSPELWHSMIQYLRKQNSQIQFGHGQEDSYEGFTMLMQCWENISEIRTLFEHTYHDNYLCPDCRTHKFTFEHMNEVKYKNITDKNYEAGLKTFNKEQKYEHESKNDYSGWIPIMTHFIVNHDFTGGDDEEIKKKFGCETNFSRKISNPLQDFIMCPKTILEDVCCSNCKSKCDKLKYSSLAVLPEILVIVIKKYHFIKTASKLNIVTQLPDRLSFEANSGKTLMYKPIVQIMHTGGIGGGHYWAHAIRKLDTTTEYIQDNYKWFNLNDNSATYISAPIQKFVSDTNSYTVIYHLM